MGFLCFRRSIKKKSSDGYANSITKVSDVLGKLTERSHHLKLARSRASLLLFVSAGVSALALVLLVFVLNVLPLTALIPPFILLLLRFPSNALFQWRIRKTDEKAAQLHEEREKLINQMKETCSFNEVQDVLKKLSLVPNDEAVQNPRVGQANVANGLHPQKVRSFHFRDSHSLAPISSELVQAMMAALQQASASNTAAPVQIQLCPGGPTFTINPSRPSSPQSETDTPASSPPLPPGTPKSGPVAAAPAPQATPAPAQSTAPSGPPQPLVLPPCSPQTAGDAAAPGGLRGMLDWLVNKVVDDGPHKRVALICQNCRQHNGLARPELAEVHYICKATDWRSFGICLRSRNQELQWRRLVGAMGAAPHCRHSTLPLPLAVRGEDS
ncbi:hypothetical protein PAPYR_4922 [Paratrimastix pyriformis]|uniref:Endoplasmic reticulum junction formation protein lunapark n=1 Tax=Paratrimastix pyriformis TaxID=342808 RepID=A0ABQ8UP73_9EUKA|nr:hypothetical protein PAPYR_4922 [Paratrimastix pyriformis]